MISFIGQIIANIKKLNLNLFDWLVIASICLVIGIFLVIRLVQKQSEWVNVRLMISNDEWWWPGELPDSWYVDGLYVGQQSFNSFRQKVAEIRYVSVREFGSLKRSAVLEIKLLALYDKKTKSYKFNFQPLQIGKPLDLTFEKNNVRGLVMYIGSEESTLSERVIEVQTYNEMLWQAESYKEGLQMKDMQGNVLAEVLSVESEVSKNYEFYDDNAGRRFVLKGLDEDRRDSTIVLRLKTFYTGELEYYVDGTSLRIGNTIWIQLPRTVIKEANITKIYESY